MGVGPVGDSCQAGLLPVLLDSGLSQPGLEELDMVVRVSLELKGRYLVAGQGVPNL